MPSPKVPHPISIGVFIFRKTSAVRSDPMFTLENRAVYFTSGLQITHVTVDSAQHRIQCAGKGRIRKKIGKKRSTTETRWSEVTTIIMLMDVTVERFVYRSCDLSRCLDFGKTDASYLIVPKSTLNEPWSLCLHFSLILYIYSLIIERFIRVREPPAPPAPSTGADIQKSSAANNAIM